MTDSTEPVSTEELAQEGMLEALVSEIQERAQISTHFKEERDSAKTEPKRKHFHKKLVRNNEETADLMVALEQMVKARELNETTVDAEGDASSSSKSTESSD